jgi:hypothetical protein
MSEKHKPKRSIFSFAVCLFLIAVVLVVRWLYPAAKTLHELLTENKQLKEAILTLTHEDQVGYAKVISREEREGKEYVTVRFVETARDDKLRKILEKEYTFDGDVIHFDALIVKFDDEMVMDGEERALYLWHRIYSDSMSPEEGFELEEEGGEPARYDDLLKLMPSNDRELFWSNIWGLANDPEKLQEYGITAIYGNVVYSKMKDGLIYVFKINSSGQLYPEIVPDM